MKKTTKDLWHEYYESYIADPVIGNIPFVYDKERTEKAYDVKVNDFTRLYFSIIHGGKVVGEIYLKHIDETRKLTSFGIALINDFEKDKGYGTEAIKLLCDFAFNTLGFKSIIADSVLRNTRSQHVLEKIGFKYTHEDDDFKYYKLEKDSK